MYSAHKNLLQLQQLFLYKNIPRLVKNSFISYQQLNIITGRSTLVALLLYFKNHSICLYKTLVDIVGYDVPGKTYRFCVVYSLLSHVYNSRINVYTYTNETIWIPSVVSLYNSANWQERELFDLYGICFKNNRDLRRILTDYGFQGFPFRKDFPLIGFVEYYYNERTKLICPSYVESASLLRSTNSFKTII